jgi:hypothetical protein
LNPGRRALRRRPYRIAVMLAAPGQSNAC